MAERTIDRLLLPSDPRRLRDARRWIAGIAREAGLGDRRTFDLATAVGEACANAYRHAYRSRPDGDVELRAEVDGGRLVVSVRDWGCGFDPSAWKRPELGSLSEGGWGLYLIGRLVDRFELLRERPGTHVVLTMELGCGAPPGEERG